MTRTGGYASKCNERAIGCQLENVELSGVAAISLVGLIKARRGVDASSGDVIRSVAQLVDHSF